MNDAKRSELRYPIAGIGYPIGFDEVALETLELLDEKAERVPYEKGEFLRYADPSGAELWRHLDEESNYGPLYPYFEGEITHRAFLNMVVKNYDHGFAGVGASCGDQDISSMEEVKVFMAVNLPAGHAYQNLRDTAVDLKVTAIPETGVNLMDFGKTEELWAQMKSQGTIPFLASDFVPNEAGKYPTFEGNNQVFTLIRKVEKKTNASNGREFLHVIGEIDKGYLLDIVVETIFFPGEILPGRSMLGNFNLYGMIVNEGRRVGLPQ